MDFRLHELLTHWREPQPDGRPGITEVFYGALGPDGDKGFQCEIGFGDMTTLSFQAPTLHEATVKAHQWAEKNLKRTIVFA